MTMRYEYREDAFEKNSGEDTNFKEQTYLCYYIEFHDDLENVSITSLLLVGK